MGDVVEAGVHVEIRWTALDPERRASALPPETRSTPYVVRARGMLLTDSKIGNTVRSAPRRGASWKASSRSSGRPADTHTFGRPPQALVEAIEAIQELKRQTALDLSCEGVMSRKADILLKATGLDYSRYMAGPIAFDYEGLLRAAGYEIGEVRAVQRSSGVGNTPLIELKNITQLVRAEAETGKGGRIFVKDEACNLSGSFKDRRASVSAHHAKAAGYPGLIAATSGNYGAAVASQVSRYGLAAIIVQETFDSVRRGQPEIIEKGRKCATLGAEVLQTTVGPELFYLLLTTLEEPGYFNASLYTPFSISGIETLGYEIAEQTRAATDRDPAAVLITHAGGGNVTGIARGLAKAGADSTQVVAVSVDLTGLHMASDIDFNPKSFTTGHTGFAKPFSSWPDRVDVPKNAARSLRYLDRFVTVTQGEVFFATELLARTEGLERGPAGNTSLAAAIVVARELGEDQILVVSETEYTGAGKSPVAQLSFAESMGVAVTNGLRELDAPGSVIAIPTSLASLGATEVDLDKLRKSCVRQAVAHAGRDLNDEEIDFLAADVNCDRAHIEKLISEVGTA